MAPELVNVDNFARAETNRMFSALLRDTGGVNEWLHNRVPTPLDHQPVIRQNRDTLYSGVIANVSAGAALTIPNAGDRYASVMAVNQDHYINLVLHDPGEHRLTEEQLGSRYVLFAARILVDPGDPDDVAAVNALQDQFALEAGSAQPFDPPAVDDVSLTTTRNALLELAKGLGGFAGAFGRREDVDLVRHLIATAAAWGGLPDEEAYYLNVNPGLPVGEYALTVRDVPVDGFWSISVYNADGYFEPNDRHVNSINNLTAVPDDDGSITINFGGEEGQPNSIPIPEGWNYLVRLYRPRPEVLDGSWTFPTIQPG